MSANHLRHSPVESTQNLVHSHSGSLANSVTLAERPIQDPTPTPDFALAVEQELQAYQQRIEQLEASLRLAVRERSKAEQDARDVGGQLGDAEHAATMARREAQAGKEEVGQSTDRVDCET